MPVFIKPTIIIGNAIIRTENNVETIDYFTDYGKKFNEQIENTEYCSNDITNDDLLRFCYFYPFLVKIDTDSNLIINRDNFTKDRLHRHFELGLPNELLNAFDRASEKGKKLVKNKD